MKRSDRSVETCKTSTVTLTFANRKICHHFQDSLSKWARPLPYNRLRSDIYAIRKLLYDFKFNGNCHLNYICEWRWWSSGKTLDCRSRDCGLKSQPQQKFICRVLAHRVYSAHSVNEYQLSMAGVLHSAWT